MDIDIPLKFVGDEHDPSHVVIELSGTVRWKAKGGFLEGITFRRPRISGKADCSGPILSMEHGACLDMVHCVFNNEGGWGGDVATISGGKGQWLDVHIKGSRTSCGLLATDESDVQLKEVCHLGV